MNSTGGRSRTSGGLDRLPQLYFEYCDQVENNQFINLTSAMIVAGCGRHIDNNTGIAYIRCKGTRNFNTARERWWFIAVSNCNSSRGLKIRFVNAFFIFKNGPTPASFCLLSFFQTEKNVGLSRIRTRIVGVKGEHADHLTTTTLVNALLIMTS